MLQGNYRYGSYLILIHFLTRLVFQRHSFSFGRERLCRLQTQKEVMCIVCFYLQCRLKIGENNREVFPCFVLS